jgi:hypothetical protein
MKEKSTNRICRVSQNPKNDLRGFNYRAGITVLPVSLNPGKTKVLQMPGYLWLNFVVKIIRFILTVPT